MHRDGALRRIAVTVAQHGGAGVDEIRAVNQHKITSVIGVYAKHQYTAERSKVVNLIEIEIDSILNRVAL